MPMNNALRDEWVRAGYDSRMGSAAVVSPPPPDFIRLYHLTSMEYAIGNLALGRMKVARFGDVNDPFELMPFNLKNGHLRAAVKKCKEDYGKRIGLLCFSRDWTNPVLWSHYAAKHRGVCLGFDIPRRQVLEVQYVEKRVEVTLGKGDDAMKVAKGLQERALRTKFLHWQYEEECRMTVTLSDAFNEGSLYFYPFDATLKPAEVILGIGCDLSLAPVRALLSGRYPDAIAYKARLADKFFKVVPDHRTVP